MQLCAPFAMAIAAIALIVNVGPVHAQQVRIASNDYSADWGNNLDRVEALEAELASVRERLGDDAHACPQAACCPTVGTCPGPFASVDFLYLKPRRTGQDYAIFDPAATGDFETQQTELRSRPGLRFTLGYLTASGWDVAFTYTTFHSRDARTTDADGGNLQPTRGFNAPLDGDGFGPLSHSAHARANLTYDVFDLETGRWFHPCDSVSVRGFFGARAALIDQDFQAQYRDGNILHNARNFTRFQGYGLRAGGEAHWWVRHNISLFGRAAASVLVGEFDSVWRHENLEGLTVTNSYFDTVPVLETAIGANYQRGPLSLQSGFESQTWFNLSQRESLSFNNFMYANNDLGLDGFFTRVSYIY